MSAAANGESRQSFRAYRFLGPLLAVLAFFAGCGGGDTTYPVRGQVTYQGQPLQQGTVMFNPTDAALPPVLARIGSDGKYDLRAAPGEYKVILTVVAESDVGLEPDEDPTSKPSSLIPEKYSNPMMTPLQATIEEKENVVDLEL